MITEKQQKSLRHIASLANRAQNRCVNAPFSVCKKKKCKGKGMQIVVLEPTQLVTEQYLYCTKTAQLQGNLTDTCTVHSIRPLQHN